MIPGWGKPPSHLETALWLATPPDFWLSPDSTVLSNWEVKQPALGTWPHNRRKGLPASLGLSPLYLHFLTSKAVPTMSQHGSLNKAIRKACQVLAFQPSTQLPSQALLKASLHQLTVSHLVHLKVLSGCVENAGPDIQTHFGRPCSPAT